MALLTVIMPVYNGEKHLEEAVDSILNQTFTDFKLLILNDKSNDGTTSILKNYEAKDNRVEIINKSTNQGPAHLRNEGVKLATTKYIALMDADDIAMPTRFEKQIELLKNNPKIGLCGTWFTIFGDRKEKKIRHNEKHEALKVQFLNSCGIGNPTVMFKKEVLGDLKFEDRFVPAEDYGLWSELIRVTEFYNIPEFLLRYRWHPDNISQTKKEELKRAEVLIKKRQLKHFGINENEVDINSYLNAVSLKRKLPANDVIAAIEASKKLKKRNSETHYFDEAIFNAHINKTIIRTIRNSSEKNPTLLKYIKNESGYFEMIPLMDKMGLYFKGLFK